MNPTAFYHGMTELLKEIKNHIQEGAHAIVFVNDYLSLQTLCAKYDVEVLKKASEQQIATAEDWELVKKTFIPTLSPEQQEQLKPLLEK